MSLGFWAVAFGPAATGFAATALVAVFLSSAYLLIVWGIGFCAATGVLAAGAAGFTTIFFATALTGDFDFTTGADFLATGFTTFLGATAFTTVFLAIGFATDFLTGAFGAGFLATGLATDFLATGLVAFGAGLACFFTGAAFLTGVGFFLGAVFFAAGFTAFFEVAMLLAFFYIHNYSSFIHFNSGAIS
jgi:hypothetical protein